MSITLGWFSLPVSNHSSLVWDLRTKKHVKILNWETTQALLQPKKRYDFKRHFHGILREFFWGMTASTQLGLSTERAAVPLAAAVVAPWQRLPPRWQIQPSGPRPVASAMEGWEAPAEKRCRKNTWINCHFLPHP